MQQEKAPKCGQNPRSADFFPSFYTNLWFASRLMNQRLLSYQKNSPIYVMFSLQCRQKAGFAA
jgi:hypothetical protein